MQVWRRNPEGEDSAVPACRSSSDGVDASNANAGHRIINDNVHVADINRALSYNGAGTSAVGRVRYPSVFLGYDRQANIQFTAPSLRPNTQPLLVAPPQSNVRLLSPEELFREQEIGTSSSSCDYSPSPPPGFPDREVHEQPSTSASMSGINFRDMLGLPATGRAEEEAPSPSKFKGLALRSKTDLTVGGQTNGRG